MKEKILITGSAGFIGSYLCKSLIEDGNDVLGIDNLYDLDSNPLKKNRLEELEQKYSLNFKKIDICDYRILDKVFNEFKPNKVVHLAARTGIRVSSNYNIEYINSNVLGFTNIIELSRKFNIDGLIYASSSSVYGGSGELPFSTEDKINKPLSIYGATKIANELIAHSYYKMYELNSTGLRFFNVYGPKGRTDMAYYIFTDRIYNNKSVDLYNFGQMERDLTYIDDVIDGIKQSIIKNPNCEIFNLGTNRSISMKRLIEIIEQILDKKAIVNLCGENRGEMYQTLSDIDKTKKILNYKPKIDVEHGMQRFIDWYIRYSNDL